MELPDLELMREEHNAWLDFVDEWKRLFPKPSGVDLNAKICNPLVRSIEVWGEKLVSLRMSQEAEVRERALRERTEAYDRAKAER